MRCLPIFVCAMLSMACLVSADPVMKRGKLDSVTVYRGQALVSRQIELPDQPGLHEIVVTDLPARVVPGSLFGESGEGIQVRSVLFRTRASSQDVREDVRKLDTQIEAKTRQINGAVSSLGVIKANAAYLAKLEQFSTTTATTELAHGILNADTLDKLTKMIFTQRQQMADATLELEVKQADMQKELALLQRQRAEITQNASTTLREAVLLIDTKKPAGQVRLSYLVDAASWAPSYTLNANSGKDQVTVLYQAAISQMSGEDWTDVKMTLSTATPSVVATAPTLDPLVLALARVEQPAGGAISNESAVKALQEKRKQVLKGYNSMNRSPENSENSNSGPMQQMAQPGEINAPLGGKSGWADAQRENISAANRVADEIQMFEINNKDKAASRSLSRGDDETIIVSYSLESRTTLLSRADQQLVGIASLPMKAGFYKLAVPVLTPYVYNQAAVTNDSTTVLLNGPSVAYLDGQFVGRGEVPTTATGAEFTAGFGIDSSLRGSRELVDRTEQTQGGNLVITFDYRLTLENFSDKPADVRLLTRMPKPDGNQLKPTLVSSSIEVSKDPEFERTQKKQGLLRWDVPVPARAIGAAARNVDYRLTVEHDKQMTIINTGSNPKGEPAAANRQ